MQRWPYVSRDRRPPQQVCMNGPARRALTAGGHGGRAPGSPPLPVPDLTDATPATFASMVAFQARRLCTFSLTYLFSAGQGVHRHRGRAGPSSGDFPDQTALVARYRRVSDRHWRASRPGRRRLAWIVPVAAGWPRRRARRRAPRSLRPGPANQSPSAHGAARLSSQHDSGQCSAPREDCRPRHPPQGQVGNQRVTS